MYFNGLVFVKIRELLMVPEKKNQFHYFNTGLFLKKGCQLPSVTLHLIPFRLHRIINCRRQARAKYWLVKKKKKALWVNYWQNEIHLIPSWAAINNQLTINAITCVLRTLQLCPEILAHCKCLRLTLECGILWMSITRSDPKVRPSVLLCCPTTSDADFGGVAVETKTSWQYYVTFCCCTTDYSRGADW